ncbi:MAG: aspartate-semialdehyde dehydrogenase [Deltaproteobacteria bacterium]|nr:aspartate-semialdehyde dehydrogenase [Deltaproteobacteria bacterium]
MDSTGRRSDRRASEGRPLSVAVVGATGAVGEVLLDVLAEREFPLRELRLLASGRSAGTYLSYGGRQLRVLEARPEAFEGADLVFFAATGDLSHTLAPEAVARGAVVIDKSSSWRMSPAVPLVVPEVNPEALDAHSGIVACPNCTTIGVVMALAPLQRTAGLERVVATTLQAVSGAGRDGIEELEAQRSARAGEAPAPSTFAAPIHDNVVPLCDALDDDGHAAEEIKLVHETRKILDLASLPISVTCVRVPVAVGHSTSLLVSTTRPLDPAAAREALAAFPGVEVVDESRGDVVPTPADVVGRDTVVVGRVRSDTGGQGLALFQVANNLRKGAATNAVQIAETLIERGLLTR